jgi:hypothetical protein
VEGINKNNFIVFEGRVLGNPVRIQYSQTSQSLPQPSLSNSLEISHGLKLVNSMALRFTIGTTLGDRALATTTTDSDTVDDKTLLGSISETTGLVRSGWMRHPDNFVQLTVLPAADTKQKSHNIALLLPVQLLHILVRSHSGEFLEKTLLPKCRVWICGE